MGGWVYMVRCADGSYYVGSTSNDPDERVGEHNAGKHAGYTSTRLPVTLLFQEHFPDIRDAHDFERRIKGWSRAKKEALIRRDWDALPTLAKRRGGKAKAG